MSCTPQPIGFLKPDAALIGPADPKVGRAHAILVDDEGCRRGGTDPRADGAAIGW